MRRRALAAIAALLTMLLPTPAAAAGVGFSLPKFRALTLDGATSWGASVQVVGGAFSLGPTRLDLDFDYAYTRDFAAGANYSFFDAAAGLGYPMGFTPQLYVVPAVDVHALAFVAAPQNPDGPMFGVAPRLTVGYRPSRQISMELGASRLFFGRGGLTTVELEGTYSF